MCDDYNKLFFTKKTEEDKDKKPDEVVEQKSEESDIDDNSNESMVSEFSIADIEHEARDSDDYIKKDKIAAALAK